ncbi:hypothetical protein ACFL6I_18095 [candidate division KSB1 bacterium]
MKIIFDILKFILKIVGWLILISIVLGLIAGVLWLLWLFITVVLPVLIVIAAIIVAIIYFIGVMAKKSENINLERNSEEYDYPDVDIYAAPLRNELHKKGFETEYVASGYLKIYHPHYPKHIAIIERDGSISLSRDIADKIPGKKSYRSGNVGRFIYRWNGAKKYSSTKIVQLLYDSI